MQLIKSFIGRRAVFAIATGFIITGGLFVSAPLAHAAPTPTTLTIVSPNGGEIWSGTHSITWTSTDGVSGDEVTLAWSTDNFVSTSNLIAENIPYGLGTYSWDTNTVAGGTNYRVRVVAESNPSVFDSSNANFTVDNTAPTISGVSIPDAAMNIGDTVTATITVGNDAGVTYTLVSGAIDGFTLGSLIRTSATTYTATFTVTGPGMDIAAGDDIPVTNLVLADTAVAPNQSAAFNGSVSPAGAADSIDANVPVLSSVTIASNNASTTWAKTDDIVTVSFTANEALGGTPVVTIRGGAASVTGSGTTWTATRTMLVTDTEGVVPFTIDFSDVATNAGTQVTALTSGSDVVFDRTAPATPSITSIAGDNLINNAEQTDVHVVGTAEANSTVSVTLTGGASVGPITGSASGAGAFDITLDTTALTDGAVTPSVTATDAAGNTSTADTAPTATKDVVAAITSITSNATGAGVLKIGNTITFTMTPSTTEDGAAVSGSYNGQPLSWSTADSGVTYTATYTVTSGNNDQTTALQISGVTYTDVAGNTSASASGTDIVKTIDANVPTLTSVTISSNNANPIWAKTGDIVTVSFTANEALAEGDDEPVVSIAGHAVLPVNVSGSGTTWTAAYIMLSGEAEGIVPFTIDFKDVATNAGTQVTALTSGPSVTYDETAPATPSITSIAGDNLINNAEKAAVHVVGTAETNSTVSVTLTDTASAFVTIIGSADGTGAYDITLDTTALLDGVITPAVNATDAAGNTGSNVSTPTATKDVLAPTVSSITTKDSNTNGTVDKATIVFSEAVKDSTFGTGTDFSIGGSAGTGFSTGSADDNTVDITHAGVASTTKHIVAYTPGTATDLAGNPLAGFSQLSTTDEAKPVLLSARTVDTTHISLLFSEDLNGSTVNDLGGEFAVAGYDVSAASETSDGMITLTVATMPTDAVPDVTYTQVEALDDLNSNTAVTPKMVSAVDGVAPVLTVIHIATSNANALYAKTGDTVTITFTSSETIGTPTVLINGIAATVDDLPTNDWAAHRVMTATDTEGPVTFSIVYADIAVPATNAGVTETAVDDASSVLFDRTNPSIDDMGGDKEVNATVAQDATVTDPVPASGVNTYTWTNQTPGVGIITFSNPSGTGTGVDTNISADTDGTYTLRLTVTDNAGNSAFDEITFIWDTTMPELLTSSPIDGTTGISISAGTATVTFDESIVLIDAAKVLLVNNSTSASYKGAVAVSGLSPAVLTIAYSGLEYGTVYRINVKSGAVRDVAGNVVTQSQDPIYFTTIIDTLVPVVNSLSAGTITTTGAILSVTTDEAANCSYATTDSAYAGMTAFTTTGGTSHTATITGLTPSTGYDFYVRCQDTTAQLNTMTTSAHVSFTTLTPDTAAPVITNIQASGITTTGAIITWTTDESAGGTVEYGLTSSYGSSQAQTGGAGTSHTATLSGLTPGSTYHFRVISTDGSSNTGTSGDNTFDTTVVADSTTPPVPSITTGTATVNSDSYTISGTAGADTPSPTVRTVSVYNGATLAGTAVVPIGQTGWSVSVTLTQNATSTFTAISADASGNVSAASASVDIGDNENVGADVTAPDVPAITTGTDAVDADTYEIAGTVANDGGVRTISVFESGFVVGTVVLPAGQTTWSVTVTLLQDVVNVFTAKATDEAGNTSAASASLTITEATVVDGTPPVITLLGINPQTLTVGDTYTELGATASDDVDGDISGSITIDSSAVNMAVAGTYVVTYNVSDAEGNDATEETRTVVVEAAFDDTASLAVTGIDAVDTFADDTDSFTDGWSWTFHITVPTDETEFAMKFTDFTSGANIILAAGNIRYYSAQSTEADTTGEVVTIAGANTYPGNITLDGDADASTAGRQIEVMVEMKVPVGSAGGSYSAQYGVSSDTI